MRLHRRVYLIGLMALCAWFQANSQINAGPDVTICQGESSVLFATATGGYGSDSYSFELFSFQPESYTGGTPVTFGGNQDDQIAGPFPIGFEFCFFNQNYTQFYIGSNGWIGFTYNSSWTTYTSAPIPNSSSTVPKNCIMAPWQDWHPGVTSAFGPPYVFYKTTGTAPNRKLVVYWYESPMFSCTSSRGTFQIVLNEQSSIIENHITSKPSCLTWAGGTATQGVHNNNGTIAFTATGRNSTQWTASNESTRFVPSGIKWYTGGYPGGTIAGYGPELIVSPQSTTVYTAVVNLCGGQVYTDNVTVNVIPRDNAAFSYGSSTLCQSGFSGNPVGSFPGGIYLSSPPGLSINAATGNINLGASNPGSYTITHITGGACPDTASIPVTVVTSPSALFGYPQTGYCVTGTNPLPVFPPGSSGGTFAASPPGLIFVSVLTGEIDLQASAPGTYQVTNTIPPSAACPQVTHTTTVQIYSTPSAGGAIQGPASLCENPPNSVYNTAPLANSNSYLWALAPPAAGTIQGNGTSAMVNWTDNFAGTAYIQVRGVNECGTGPGSPPFAVQVNPLPKETGTPAGPEVLCQGAALTIYFTSGSAFASHYEWMLVPAGAGVVVGQGQQVTVSWAASFSGTAQLSVRGANECGTSVWSLPLEVLVNPLPAMAQQPSGPVFVCSGDAAAEYSTPAVLNASGYQWMISPANAGIINGSGNTVTINWNAAFSGMAGVSVALVNECGAGSQSLPLMVEIAPAPVVNAGNDTTILAGTSIILRAEVQSAGNQILYSWEPADLLVNPIVLQPVTLPLGTSVRFTLVSSDAVNGCSGSDNVWIEVTGSPLTVSAGADPPAVCAGEGTSLQAYAMGGQGAGYQYSWYVNGVFFSNLQSPFVIPDESSSYEVVVFDGTDLASATVTVVVWQLPVVDAGDNIYIPAGGTAQLKAGVSPPGDYFYKWIPADSLINPFVAEPYTVPLFSGNLFQVTITDVNGCSSLPGQVSVIVTGGLLGASPLANPDTICQGTKSILYAMPYGGLPSGYHFRWYDGSTLVSEDMQFEVQPTASTNYRLLVGDGISLIERYLTVTVLPVPKVELIAPGVPHENNTILACVFDTVVIDLPHTGASFLWSDGSVENIIFIRTSGISFDFRQIWVVVTDQSTGCFTREEVNVLFNFINCSYGIRENEKKSSVRIFPNPAGESVNIGLDRDPEGNLDIQILDIQGRIVAEHTARSHAAGQATVDVAHLPEGIYLVKVTSSAGVFVRKLIISRGY